MHALENIVGLNYASEFYHIPDAGFFTEAVSTYHPEIDANKKKYNHPNCWRYDRNTL